MKLQLNGYEKFGNYHALTINGSGYLEISGDITKNQILNICKAVNNHEKLVETLKRIQEVIAYGIPDEGVNEITSLIHNTLKELED